MSERDGFHIDNLEKYETILLKAKQELPKTMQNMLETLGETLLNLAKEYMRSETSAHAAFKKSQNKISRGQNKGQNRITVKYAGSDSRSMVDQGGLWNSFSRGGRSNVWSFNGSSQALRLKVGSSVKYAKYVHDGYTIKADHWVPGVIDGNGIFRYKKGAKSGIMARARTFKGVPFLEVSLAELEKLAPSIVRTDLQKLFGGYAK